MSDVGHHFYDLHSKAMAGDWGAVRKVLNEIPDINAQDEDGDTLLIFATKSEESHSIMLLQMIIEQGADIDHRNKWNDTALIHAVHGNHLEKLRLLVNAGGSLEIKGYHGLTALGVAEHNGGPCIVNVHQDFTFRGTIEDRARWREIVDILRATPQKRAQEAAEAKAAFARATSPALQRVMPLPKPLKIKPCKK